MSDLDYIYGFFEDGGDGSPESEGVYRAKTLQENLIKIAKIAADCEVEQLGPQTIKFYKKAIKDVISGKYQPQTLDSFMSYIDPCIYFLFGDIPEGAYVVFVRQIIGDVVNLFVETYAYCLKTALENALLMKLEEK